MEEFIGVDVHISNEDVGAVVRAGFFIIAALGHESDIEFLERCHDYGCLGVLSKDTDIGYLLDSRDSKMIHFKSVSALKKWNNKRGNFDAVASKRDRDPMWKPKELI